jgi:heme o synthase
VRNYLALCKPRITVMVAATTSLGYSLAGGKLGADWLRTTIGVTLASAACGTLNQYLERLQDGRMNRTKARPLPSGKLSPSNALFFGLALTACSLLLVKGLALILTAATMALYLLAYTPLKRVTPHTTWFGAAAGALPPVIGWAAASGSLSAMAWILFAIQFLWQIPHFLAMFWLHRADYAAAGFQVMPVVDPQGGLTAAQIAVHCLTMLLASLAPSLLGLAGSGYGLGALALGTAYLALGMRASWTLAVPDTRRLFLASLAYLPILFGMLLVGGV